MTTHGTNSKLYRGTPTADGGMEWQELGDIEPADSRGNRLFYCLLWFVFALIFAAGVTWGYLAAKLLFNLQP